MGIRFSCHHCNHALHLKSQQAGRRGICPACKGRFRIPQDNRHQSLPIDDSTEVASDSKDSGSAQPLAIKVQKSDRIEKGRFTTDGIVESNPRPVARNASWAADNELYWVRPPSGGEYGPATLEMLKAWARETRITRDSLVARDKSEQWLPAWEVKPSLFSESDKPIVSEFTLEHRASSAKPMYVATEVRPVTSRTILASEKIVNRDPIQGQRIKKSSPELITKIRRRKKAIMSQYILFIGMLVIIIFLVAALVVAINR